MIRRDMLILVHGGYLVMSSTLLKIPEAARILNINKNTLYLWIKDGKIPAIRIGRTLRIHPDAIEQLQNDPSVMP